MRKLLENILAVIVGAAAAGALISFFIGLGLLWTLAWGWVLFITYRSFAPETWPELGLWTATGIVLLITLFMRQARSNSS